MIKHKPKGWSQMTVGERLRELRLRMPDGKNSLIGVSRYTRIARHVIRNAENTGQASDSVLDHLARFYGLEHGHLEIIADT